MKKKKKNGNRTSSAVELHIVLYLVNPIPSLARDINIAIPVYIRAAPFIHEICDFPGAQTFQQLKVSWLNTQ